MALAANMKKGKKFTSKNRGQKPKGLLISQRSYAITVKNWVTMPEIVINLGEDLEGRGFMPLL